MQIGIMRERILIQKRVVHTDSIGNHTSSWEDFEKRWAYANHLSGSEYWAAAQVQAQDSLYFLIRCDRRTRQIDTVNFRIQFREQIYNIQAIDNVQYRNEVLKITVKSEGET